MRAIWLLHRRLVLGFGIVLVLVGVVAIAAITDAHGGSSAGGASGSGTRTALPLSRGAKARTPAKYTPATVEPVETPTQARIDSQLARAESPSSIAAAEALTVQTARDSSAYPAVPDTARENPAAYASSFTTELLDRNYASQSRAELLAWAQGEEAPNTLPGVPTSIANKALYASLTDPGPAGGSGSSPVPSPVLWARGARSGTTQKVSDLLVDVDPSWTQLIEKGWEPRDPLMTMMDVTGSLVVSTGATTTTEAVSMVLALGSCERAPGLGAIAVQDWTVR